MTNMQLAIDTIFEVPSNLVMNKMAPSLYLSIIMAVWGACVAAMSQCRNRTDLLVGRFFLGCIEAGVFPGSLYLLTCWYTKKEVGT
jgi:MFS family permease